MVFRLQSSGWIFAVEICSFDAKQMQLWINQARTRLFQTADWNGSSDKQFRPLT
jgi:hypothetical protein